jgi:hypothetical protein
VTAREEARPAARQVTRSLQNGQGADLSTLSRNCVPKFDYHCRVGMPANPIRPALRGKCVFLGDALRSHGSS